MLLKAVCRWSGLALCFGVLVACQNTPSSSSKSESQSLAELTEPAQQQEVTLQLNLSAVLKQVITPSSQERHVAFTPADVFSGTLSVDEINDGLPAVDHPWTIGLDDSTFDVESLKTLVIAPGTYDFDLTVTRGVQQYHAELSNHVVAEGANTVPLTLRPVIGDILVDVSDSSLPSFQFQYDPSELGLASFDTPQIGVRVGGATEQIFALNPTTGLSSMFLNLSEGPETLQLRLYDGGIQRGRSLAAQESVTIVAGLDLTMDLVALQGDIEFALDVQNNDAQFDFTIPHDVVDEAGGLANLSARFSVVGPNTPFQENPLSLSFVGPDYTASITLPNFQYDDLTLSLSFEDISVNPSVSLGTCSQSITLQSSNQSIVCDLDLNRRALISGSLLSTVSISVVDEDQLPVGGAIVTADGQQIGITSDGTVGVEGNVKAFLTAGTYTIRAEDLANNKFGEQAETFAPLGIHNIEVSLDQDLLPSWMGTQSFGSDGSEVPAAITRDNNGNLYITGTTTGVIGEGPHLGGITDIFTAKFNSIGELQWVRMLGTGDSDTVADIAVDHNENVYIVGFTNGSLPGNPNPNNSFDMFVAKYDFEGTRDWVLQQPSDTGTSFVQATGVAVDSTGHIYVTVITNGFFDGTPSSGNLDTYLQKYAGNSNKLWTQQLTSSSSNNEDDAKVAVDSNDNVYVTGFTLGNIGGVNAGDKDIFLVRYNNSDGSEVWRRQLGTSAEDRPLDLTTDSNGNIYIAAQTMGGFDGATNAGDSDFVVIKYDSGGTKDWIQQSGTSGPDTANGITTDSAGNIYAVGSAQGGLNGEAHVGSLDIVLVKYEPINGTIQWTEQLGSTTGDQGRDVVGDGNGNSFILGQTEGSLDGSVPLGNNDAVLIHYNSDGVIQ